jgi:hypothetical protein
VKDKSEREKERKREREKERKREREKERKREREKERKRRAIPPSVVINQVAIRPAF